jgi:hypothetical protein
VNRSGERERGKKLVVSDTKIVGKENNLTSFLNVPRPCPFVLPVRVSHLTGVIEV